MASADSSQFGPRWGNPAGLRRSRLPVHKLISRRAWKLWGAVLLVFALAAGTLGLEVLVVRGGHGLGPGIERLSAPESARLTETYVCLLLLVSGQLCLLIWWVRSRSPGDFAGRFRVWKWGAGAFFLSAFCRATEAHLALGETVSWLWSSSAIASWELAWVLPAAVAGTPLLWGLHREMCECHASLAFLWLAVIGAFWSAALSLDPSTPLAPEMQTLAQRAFALASAACLCASLLLHARHVLYRSAEPPAPRPSGWQALRAALPWRKGASEMTLADCLSEPPAAPADPAHPSPPPAAPSRSGRSRKKPRTTTRAAASQPAVPAEPVAQDAPSPPDRDAASEPAVPSSAPALTEPPAGSAAPPPPAADTPVRADEPMDEDEFKGLSKRERRRLQKQMRARQRAAA